MKKVSFVLAFVLTAFLGSAQMTTNDSCRVIAEAFSKAHPPTPNMSRALTARQVADYMKSIATRGFNAATFNWTQISPAVSDELSRPPYGFSLSVAGWDYQLHYTFSFRVNTYSN